jgi:predicted nucleic-acid-binding Zn-ribbon protein
MTCAKCGSPNIIPRARVINRGDAGDMRVGVPRKPQALIFQGREESDIHARVCGNCGYVELFAEDAAELYRAYLQSQQGRE